MYTYITYIYIYIYIAEVGEVRLGPPSRSFATPKLTRIFVISYP